MTTNRVEKFQQLYAQGIEALARNQDEEANRLMFEAAKTAPEGWLQMAIQLTKEGKEDLAEPRFREVLQLSKEPLVRCAALNNLGMIYANRGQNALATGLFEEAAKTYPGIADSHSNQGLMHLHAARFDEALRLINRALKIDPWHEQAQFLRAMTLLQSGDYLQGFKEYECRWRSKSNGLAKLPACVPEWDGTNGKNLYVYGEQGHGDSILMLRYAPLIRSRGVRLTWVAQKSLATIVAPLVDKVAVVGDEIPDFDTHIPAVSLPRIFGTTIETIPPAPYIKAESAVDFGPGFHVGIAWKGSKAQGNDKFRSTKLEAWGPVLNIKGITFHSLQVDGEEEADTYPQIKRHPLPKDFSETANRVAGLDLIISVDTSLVHLAGAMGKPCWCALHCRPYFVFPQRLGTATPWYASVHLFRQRAELEWKPVFETIAKELQCLV